ncbi:uncharacterized protein An09g01280 [Aspergillus niger]|uniref:Contig An09c0040, genomic contig n=2 Tax=Aspergillus niger TaxID=5061 RepID=A2QT94_ASPNC|nr:uncharacterized protein An09g01280 [Aspergillus niger]CAK49050.1 unnamed protein product [Aspergillus niger]
MTGSIPFVGAFAPRSPGKPYASTPDMVMEMNMLTESMKNMATQIEQYQGGMSNLLYLTRGTYKVYDSAINARKRIASTEVTDGRNEEDKVLTATYEMINALTQAIVATSSKSLDGLDWAARHSPRLQSSQVSVDLLFLPWPGRRYARRGREKKDKLNVSLPGARMWTILSIAAQGMFLQVL